jgi:type I restriction enzyme S subunit
MTKKGELTAAPHMRFPEFRNTGSWKVAQLKDIAERVSTKNSDGNITRVLTNSAERGVLDQRDYFERDIATAGRVDGYYVVDQGAYVYNPRTSASAPVGPISRNNIGKGLMSPLYTVFRLFTEKTDFYEHYFKSTGWHSYLRRAASMGARHDRMSISTAAFMRMPVPTPDPSEQQKIAECLTFLDEVIAAQWQKVEALEAHKRGLMQLLFPREAESTPRLRFPEFRETGEWLKHELGDIADISKGRGISKSDVVEGGQTECIRYAELYTVYGEVIDTVRSRTNVPVSELVLSEAGDVIIPASGETKEDIATCACVVEAGIALGSDLNILRADVDGPFFSYYLNGSRRRQLAKVAQGDTVAHLYPRQLEKLQICIPADKAEQQRIADCLSSLDVNITANFRKLDALKAHKSGLMQQLFPSMGGG